MRTIGCDYSSKEAYLGIHDSDSQRVIHHVKVALQGDLPDQRRNYLNNLTRTFASLRENLGIRPILYIEQPWVAGRHFPQAAIQLARNCAYIEVAALAAGFDLRFVHISTWRKFVYGNGKPTDTKGTALAWVNENLEFDTRNHNFAEAACIAYYGSLN